MVSVDRRESRASEVEAELRDRVVRLVASRGVPRARVRAAVSQVVAALPSSLPVTRGASAASVPAVLATFSSTRADLSSALHLAATAAGVRVLDIGRAHEGRHSVVAALVPEDQRDRLAALAASVGAALSLREARDP